MISSTEILQAVTALPAEAGTSFTLLLYFKNLTPSYTALEDNSGKAWTFIFQKSLTKF